MLHKSTAREWLYLLLLTGVAVAIHGYHLGVEDQFVYIPAIKKHLDSSLYPYDAAFFLQQTQFTLFDELISWLVRATHLPLDVVIFTWHLLSIFLILLGCWRVSRRCFAQPAAQWAAVATLAALLTLPVAGTALLLVDQYLHPRALASVALVFALLAILEGKPSALAWIALGAVIHPTQTLWGCIHLAFQARKRANVPLLLLLPFGIALGSQPAAWRQTLFTQRYLFPQRWAWYELLGAFAPLVLLAGLARLGRRSGTPTLVHVSGRLSMSGSLGVGIGILIATLPGFERLIPLEPMRTLHLVYLFLVVLWGGVIGQYLLRDRPLRWLIFFVPLCAGMLYAQRQEFPASPHVEWPGQPPENAWVQAFDWIRRNTPRDAFFALDPQFMERPGEDFHSFRAWAERSRLADAVKDRAVALTCPALAADWRQQVHDLSGWKGFAHDDFLRLKKKYGVSWVVLSRWRGVDFPCPYANELVKVCRLEEPAPR